MTISTPPSDPRDTYPVNIDLAFKRPLVGKKLVAGSTRIEGKLWVTQSSSPLSATDQVYYDAVTGLNGMFSEIKENFSKIGSLEPYGHYSRGVKMRAQMTQGGNVGLDTRSAAAGRCPNSSIAQAYLRGRTAAEPNLPFSIYPEIATNQMNGNASSDALGEINTTFTICPVSQFLFGATVDSNTNFYLTDVLLLCDVVDDDGSRVPITMEYTASRQGVLESNEFNFETKVSGIADSCHLSFINAANQNTASQNYLACPPPPGIPPIGYSGSIVPSGYGLERAQFGLNSTDTVFTNYILESREAFLRAGVDSYNGSNNYKTKLSDLRDPVYPDGYITGMNFGAGVDLRKNMFGVVLESQADTTDANRTAFFVYFRMIMELVA